MLADLFGGLAQLGERLPCKQEVTSSNLVISSKDKNIYPKTLYLENRIQKEKKESNIKDK